MVLAAVVGIAILWLIGDRSGASLVGLTLSVGGAGIAAYLVREEPVSAFGIVFALAAISRLTVELPPGAMRLEQPAIVAVILALVAEGRVWLRPDRAAILIIFGLGVFLATLVLSSLLVAPQPIDSLRIVAWYALSIGGGIAAFLLLRGRSGQATAWLTTAGAAAGAVGLLVGVLFLVVGESWTYGIQRIGGGFPRVYAIAWEANLFASFLVAVLPFAVERFRGTPSFTRAGAMLLITMGFALAVTRGAYLGLAAGLLIQFVALAYWGSRWRRLMMPAIVVLACLLVSALAPAVLLQTPSPPPRPYPDTIGYRLARVEPALDELASSPLIGLGAESFGQRHINSVGAPDHIPILAIALPYESGFLGAIGFGVATAGLLVLLARSLRGPGATPLAAAYLGSLVSLLVAYQATNAIHFAINWLIAGGAAALISDAMQLRGASPPRTGDRVPGPNANRNV